MGNQIVKPSILPGFMELLPKDQIAFNRMMDKIRKNYEKFGFIPLDTPIIEKSEVLLAKGGGETEKQIYRFTKGDSDLSLRFDLTVPLARYVAQYMNELAFPFRRYQIGKVYRGERNQKGRFREFYQCDIDIIGSEKLSILNDAEIPSIIYSTFHDLGFDAFTIRVNNRKVLNGFFEALEIENKAEVLRSIDKLEKIGLAAVKEELAEIGLAETTIDRVVEFIEIKGSNSIILNSLKNLSITDEMFLEGLEELSQVAHYIKLFGVPEKNILIDLKIARGLDYYTGTVYETILDDYPGIGSVCSGGRYDNLAEYYTTKKLPGVGISIGLTRLFYQLREAGMFLDDIASTLTRVLIVPMGETKDYSVVIANKLREAGIITEIYLEDTKVQKKLTYANKQGIPYVIMIGDEEVTSGQLPLKNMIDGTQIKAELIEIIDLIRQGQ